MGGGFIKGGMVRKLLKANKRTVVARITKIAPIKIYKTKVDIKLCIILGRNNLSRFLFKKHLLDVKRPIPAPGSAVIEYRLID